MKYFLIFFILLINLFSAKVYSQIDTLNFIDGTYYVLNGNKIIYPNQDNGVFRIVEKATEFPGGTIALQQWLIKNVESDSTATSEKIVKAAFTINTKGLPTAIAVQGDTVNGRGKKVIKLIERMPRWKPAIQGGTTVVKMRLILPITFSKFEKSK